MDLARPELRPGTPPPCRARLVERRRQPPMLTPDGRFVLSYNGECYNYREIRRRLEQDGESFASSGDTEVVLRFLAPRGHGALDSLNGMFALAIWDDREHAPLAGSRPFRSEAPLLDAYQRPAGFCFRSPRLLGLGAHRAAC